jgi:hypothetical protein
MKTYEFDVHATLAIPSSEQVASRKEARLAADEWVRLWASRTPEITDARQMDGIFTDDDPHDFADAARSRPKCGTCTWLEDRGTDAAEFDDAFANGWPTVVIHRAMVKRGFPFGVMAVGSHRKGGHRRIDLADEKA